MTFVGKVLVVVQLVLAICFMAFAGAVYTAQDNWRQKYDQSQVELKKAQGDANTAVQQEQQRETEMTAQLQELQQKVALIDGQLKQTSDQLGRTTQELQ